MNLFSEMQKLNPQQKEAVMTTEGPLLILAGAGSGKTKVITIRSAKLIDQGVDPGQVLAVTFTNKAAKEMKERIKKILPKVKGKLPVISTFHSICLKILGEDIEAIGYKKRFSIYDTSEQLSLIRAILSDIKIYDRNIKSDLILELIGNKKNGMKPSSFIKEDEAVGIILESVYTKYQKTLRTLNALDFDDILILTVKLLEEHPEVLKKYQERFRYIMVDEYQDTNHIQYKFIKLLSAESKNICVVGDDDQSIYGWRGANIDNILSFEKEFPGTKVVKLEQNYRSLGYILKSANNVIMNNKKRMSKMLWTAKGPGQKVNILQAENTEEEAEWVANKIAFLKYDKKRNYEDFAIMYRANTFSRPFEEELRKNRIPYTVIGGTGYFDKKEVKDLIAYLKIIVNPNDQISLLRAVNAPKRGVGPTTINKVAVFADEKNISLMEGLNRIHEIADVSAGIKKSAVEFIDTINRYRDHFEKGGNFGKKLSELVNEINYRDYLFSVYKTPKIIKNRIKNVDDFIVSLENYEKSEAAPTLKGYIEAMVLVDILDNEPEDVEKSGVTLISFHSAKGLEFPVVFIAGVEEDLLPHKKSIVDGDVEEERRLFYVGITRAMKELYITYTKYRIKYGNKAPTVPSRFLDELNEESIVKLNEQKVDKEDNDKLANDFFAKMKEMLT